MEWTWSASAWGYTVYFDGLAAGGAGTARTERLSGRCRRDNARMYRLQAAELAAECAALHVHLPYDPGQYEGKGIWAWLPAARLARLRSQTEVLNGIA